MTPDRRYTCMCNYVCLNFSINETSSKFHLNPQNRNIFFMMDKNKGSFALSVWCDPLTPRSHCNSMLLVTFDEESTWRKFKLFFHPQNIVLNSFVVQTDSPILFPCSPACTPLLFTVLLMVGS